MTGLREHPPLFARSLYVILQDQKLLELDPDGTLLAILERHWHLRLANVKQMTTETTCLASIALPIRARFLELVAVCAVPYGKHTSTYMYLQQVSSLFVLYMYMHTSRVAGCSR
jgi:hypothetical protein